VFLGRRSLFFGGENGDSIHQWLHQKETCIPGSRGKKEEGYGGFAKGRSPSGAGAVLKGGAAPATKGQSGDDTEKDGVKPSEEIRDGEGSLKSGEKSPREKEKRHATALSRRKELRGKKQKRSGGLISRSSTFLDRRDPCRGTHDQSPRERTSTSLEKGGMKNLRSNDTFRKAGTGGVVGVKSPSSSSNQTTRIAAEGIGL